MAGNLDPAQKDPRREISASCERATPPRFRLVGIVRLSIPQILTGCALLPNYIHQMYRSILQSSIDTYLGVWSSGTTPRRSARSGQPTSFGSVSGKVRQAHKVTGAPSSWQTMSFQSD